MTRTGRRRAAWGGVVGPAAFIAAWSILGARASGYSPVHDPISRLAAAGQPSQAAMTGGFLAFGAGVSLYAVAIRSALSGATGLAAATTAAATVGIAALPLGTAGGDRPHAVAAGIAYTALALTPLLGARALARMGRRRAALGSVLVGVAAGASLAASAVASSKVGLLQRAGLTIGDGWIAATALWVLHRPGVPRGS